MKNTNALDFDKFLRDSPNDQRLKSLMDLVTHV